MDKVTTMTSIYNEHSPIQRNATFHTSDVLKKGILKMSKENPERFRDVSTPFTISDLGCSGGHNSVDNLKACIDTVRVINVNMAFHIFLEDTPANDFDITAQNVEIEFKDYDQITFTYVKKSFYEPLFPENSMDIIFSNTSVHWIRKTPGVHDDLLFLDNGVDQDEISVNWRKQGRDDWHDFLNLREKELRKSGLMIICTMTVSRSELLDLPFIYASKLFVDILKDFLKDYNLKEQRKDFLIPCMWKEESSIPLPFELERELKLISSEKRRVSFPLHNLSTKSDEEKENFVKKVTKFFEAFTGGIIRAGFQKNLDDDQKIELLYNEFYNRYHTENYKHFDTLKMIEGFSYIYMTIVRT